ncbi:hypothetical protein A9A89_1702 [Bifidobacterium psychraerophilum DSM 22366]|uniref:Uncharacterized protein n=1 Tax=Bifidobacterium psychraerophilum TaxID=218140 RepID=A0A087CCU4_9BIFI|nr:hypothetical protein BPSY_1499 [Bifidobacterium psychraerophilum]PKA95437.1 hypothetical protein A9A89_1702 [Bifidobacterium psychraerophilum DSM 22366]
MGHVLMEGIFLKNRNPTTRADMITEFLGKSQSCISLPGYLASSWETRLPHQPRLPLQ